MAFGTKESVEVKESKYVSKKLNPGVHKCRILGIETYEKQYKSDAQPRLILSLKIEAEKPEGEFEGFYIDKDNPKLGRHDGPIANVKANPFDFKDNFVEDKNNGGYVAKEILCARWLQRLCKELNNSNWVEENMGVHKDFDSFIEAFNKKNPLKDVYAHFVIQGNKYLKENGYPAFKYLSIAYADKTENTMGLRPYSTDQSKLIAFDASRHIFDSTNGQSVSSFNGNSNSVATPIKEEEEAPKFNEESDIDFNTPTKTSDNETADDVFAVETDSSNDDLEDVFNVE